MYKNWNINPIFLIQFEVTNMGKKERFCEDCVAIPPNSEILSSHNSHEGKPSIREQSPTRATALKFTSHFESSGDMLSDDNTYDPNSCAGCKQQLKEGQALIALDRQWHINCFRLVRTLFNNYKQTKTFAF